jgi:hypothetical protein
LSPAAFMPCGTANSWPDQAASNKDFPLTLLRVSEK